MDIKQMLSGLKLYQEIQSPGAFPALWVAVRHSAKTAIAAGVGYGLIVAVGLLQNDASQSHLLTLLFSVVSAQSIASGISKFIKTHYGVTLPF